MINLSELITDPDFCTEFTIIRDSGRYIDGVWTKQETEIITAGIAEPVSGVDLKLMPAGDGTDDFITFYTKTELKIAPDNALSDVILYNNKKYKLCRLNDYSPFGYYSAVGCAL